nr:MAG: late genes activator [Bacteriophage sp.]
MLQRFKNQWGGCCRPLFFSMFHVEHFERGETMTRGGVEYNLNISPYRYTADTGLTFVFSSKYHLDTFKNKQVENRNRLNESLSNRFNYYVEFNILADCVLYRQIEQRGFLILKDGENYPCQNIIKFGGEKAIKKNLHD